MNSISIHNYLSYVLINSNSTLFCIDDQYIQPFLQPIEYFSNKFLLNTDSHIMLDIDYLLNHNYYLLSIHYLN